MPPPIDPGHFFQTEASIAETSRKAQKAQNTSGDPIRLPSKILAIIVDPSDAGRVYVAESAGVIRRVVLDTRDKTHVYQGPSSNAPITCLTLGPANKTIVGGCWDKRLWIWDVESRVVQRTLEGHTDFVKAVIYAQHGRSDLLISGGADGTIIIWAFQDGSKLGVLKGGGGDGHTRGVLDLAVDYFGFTTEKLSLFSAGSDREIKNWVISTPIPHEKQTSQSSTVVGVEVESPKTISTAHETSVNRLRFDDDGDLWTASSDRTSRCLAREEGWKSNTELAHPDFVRDVVVDEVGGKIITACRDEEVRIWDRGTGKVYHTFSGHFEEVTGLALLARTRILVSVSIDCTIRRWSLREEDIEADKAKRVEEEKEIEEEKEEIMTEEERRELEELLEDEE